MKDGCIVKDKNSYSRNKVNLIESSCLMVDEKSSDCKKKKLTSTCVASSSNRTHDLTFVFPDELSVDEFDDHRKKRCVDRYDSSESWDSGVATLRCCSESASTSSTSDITEPGSPYNICGQLSEDSNVTFNSTPQTSVFSASSLPTFVKRPVRNMLPDSINHDENDESCWEWDKTADWNDKFELTPEDIGTHVKTPSLYHDTSSNTENVNCISSAMNVGLLDNGGPLNSKKPSNNNRSARLSSAFRSLPNIEEQMVSVHTTPGQADTLLTKGASRTPKKDYSRKPAMQKEKLPVEESFDFSSFINSSFMNRRCTQSIAPDSNLQTLLNTEENSKEESAKEDVLEPTEKTISEDKDCIEKKDYCTPDGNVSPGNNEERNEEIDPQDSFKPSKVIKRKTYYFDERLCAEDLFNKFPKFLMPILFDDDTSESNSAKLEQLGIKEIDESSSDEENGIDFSNGNLFLPKRKITDNNDSETSSSITESNSKNQLTNKNETSEPPLLSEPKVIRFPSHQSSPQVSECLCRWEGCSENITLSSKLVEHLQNKHVKPQTFSAEFVCLWSGCKVYGRASCSLSWLERHVLSHAGNKPYRCIVDGCGQSFSSQIILERHINQHFKQNKSNNKPVDASANKVIRRNGQTLRYRREPYSARGTTDIFDQAIMARMKEMATQSAESCQKYNVDYTCSKTHLNVKFEPQVVAMRDTTEYGKQYLVRWCPYNVVDDEWLAESEVKTKHVPIWMLPKDKQDFFWKVVFPYRPEKPVHSARKWKKSPSL